MKNRSSKLSVYTVRIDYENGMERMDVSAENRLGVFPHVAKLLAIKFKCTGVFKKVLAVTIESE